LARDIAIHHSTAPYIVTLGNYRKDYGVRYLCVEKDNK
jgi:hypothetical protein